MSNRVQELAKRAARLRLLIKDISGQTGLDVSTVGRVLGERTGSLTGTLDKIEGYIEGEEKRVLNELVELHGVPEKKRAAA